jgi:hypothetical protein
MPNGESQPPPPEYYAAAGAVIGADHIEKLNAGAALTYALHQCPQDWWRSEKPPLDVVRAYLRACLAYGINRHPPLDHQEK